MIKLIRILAFSLFVVFSSKAQNTGSNQNTSSRDVPPGGGGNGISSFEDFLPNHTPPNPIAFEFTKHTDVPVNESSGLIMPGINLFTLSIGEITLPITLTYQGNGIKVGQPSGLTGYNWQLEAGGLIVRELNDMPDELTPGQAIHYDANWYHSAISDSATYEEIVRNITLVGNDSEVDLFRCKSFGFTGNFFLDENFQARLVKQNRTLKINYNNLNDTIGEITLFDEIGTKFTFGGTGYTGFGNYKIIGFRIYPREFYLREVRDTKGNFLIFDYDTVIVNPQLHQVYNSIEGFSRSEIKEKVGINPSSDVCEYQLKRVIWNRFIPRENIEVEQDFYLRVKRITSSRGDSIRFIYNNAGKLSLMKVYNFQGTLVKEITFSYYDNRFLTEVNFGDNAYRFEYYDMQGFPIPTHGFYAVDVYGYYNGKLDNNGLIPGLENFFPDRIVDRSSDFNYAVKGALRKIIYPTGGIDEFEYEKVPLRIKRIYTYKNSSDTSPRVKRYYYTDLPNINRSQSINLVRPIPLLLENTSVQYLTCPDTVCSVDVAYTDVYLSGLTDTKYTIDRQNYEYVTISYGGDHFEQGGVEKRFIKRNIFPLFEFGTRTSTNNDWNAGTLLQERIFDSNLNILQKKSYSYFLDTLKSHVTYNYLHRQKIRSRSCANDPLSFHKEIGIYSTGSYWFNIKEKRTVEYFSNGNIETIERYYYDNGSAGLPSRIEKEILHDPTTRITETEYIHSPNNINYCRTPGNENDPICVMLRQHKISTPIVSKTFVDNRLLSTKKNFFQNISPPYLPFNLIVVPERIELSKGNNPLEVRARFTRYDAKGNPLEMKLENGTPLVYIWGYKQSLPVAKIKGISYEQLPAGIINQINHLNWETVSNNEVLNLLLQLRDILITNHKGLSIELYVHKPLVGLSISVDEKGDIFYYEYDAFNRLKFIKDSNGNIIKEYEYHYKDQ